MRGLSPFKVEGLEPPLPLHFSAYVTSCVTSIMTITSQVVMSDSYNAMNILYVRQMESCLGHNYCFLAQCTHCDLA